MARAGFNHENKYLDIKAGSGSPIRVYIHGGGRRDTRNFLPVPVFHDEGAGTGRTFVRLAAEQTHPLEMKQRESLRKMQRGAMDRMIMRTACVACLLVFGLPTLGAHGQGQRTRPAQIFQRLDNNADGVITRDEAPSQTAFDRADIDGDGRVTREEYSRSDPRRSDPRPGDKRERGNLDGPLPEDASQVKTDFQLVYVHQGRIAQASVILNAFKEDSTDLLIASKRRVHLVRNDDGQFDSRRHVGSGQRERMGTARL